MAVDAAGRAHAVFAHVGVFHGRHFVDGPAAVFLGRHDLETQDVAVELQGPVEVADHDGDVVHRYTAH